MVMLPMAIYEAELNGKVSLQEKWDLMKEIQIDHPIGIRISTPMPKCSDDAGSSTEGTSVS